MTGQIAEAGDKMRILHVITSLRTGGAERVVADLLPRLRDRGHHVELLLFDGTVTPLYEQLVREDIEIHSLGRGVVQMWNPLHVFRLGRYLDKKRFDIVHTHNTPCQLLTAIAAGSSAPVLVTTEHNTFNRRRNWSWYRGIDRWMYGKYGHVVCVSALAEHNLKQRLGGDVSGISVIPNGTDLKRFSEAMPGFRRPDEADKKIVMMAAAFRKQKDQPTLIRAMRHLPEDYRLWLAGDWTLRGDCEKLATSLGLNERVRFLGFRKDVPALLAASDVVILSSHYEGMPLSAIEGMASGKPFIASDVDGMRDIVGGAGLLFPQGDDAKLAGLIRQVCEDRDYGASVAARCKERSMCYDIMHTVSEYERLYEAI